MNNTREKLIELLDNAKYKYQVYEADKDHKMRTAKSEAEFDLEASTYEIRHSFYARELIANGVTIQKWIPVTERLPEKDETVLTSRGYLMNTYTYFGDDKWEDDYGYYGNTEEEGITHWMPLPEPPKGG